MKNRFFIFLLIVFVVGLFTFAAFAQDKPVQYVGSKKCKSCHNSKKSGYQFKIWAASPHANAYTTLASEESKAIAKKMGIKDPQKSEKCLICHVTGAGKDASMFAKTFNMEEGVGCEACHGPGSVYKSMKIMKDIYAGKVKGADYGLINADEAQCKTCHNKKSPTYKVFDFKKHWEKLAHPVPVKK